MSTAVTESCKRGIDLTLYYNTGTNAAQVWVEHVGIIEDLSMPETEDENELTGRRVTRQVKEYTDGDIDISITGTQVCDPEYEGWQFLNSMRNGGPSRDVMCLTGKIGEVGSYGWRGDFRNFDRSFNGPATGNLTNAFNLKPAVPCRADHVGVRVVKVAVADAIADFDPTDYEVASVV